MLGVERWILSVAGPRALIVCVNYFTESHVKELVKSLAGQTDKSWLLAIVDNGSNTSGADDLRRLTMDERVLLLHPGTNLGYFGGASWGYDELTRQSAWSPDWVIVCNPDIRFAEAETLRRLSRHDSAKPMVIGPAIIGPRGDDQNPFLATVPSRRRSIFRFAITYSRGLGLVKYVYVEHIKPHLFRSKGGAPGKARAVFAAHGSCICFSSGYFKSGLDLSHPLFLFGEEVVIARRCVENRVPIVYDPNIRTLHSRHASFGRFKSGPVAAHQRAAAKLILRELSSVRRSKAYPLPRAS